VLIVDDHPDTLEAMCNLAILLSSDESLALQREVVSRARRSLPKDHPSTVAYERELGMALANHGDEQEAETLLRGVVDADSRVLGNDHPETDLSRCQLAMFLRDRKPQDAEPLFRDCWQWRAKRHGDEHIATLLALGNLALCIEWQHRLDEAIPLYKRLFETSRAATSDAATAAGMSRLYGLALVKAQRFTDAEAPLLESLERLRAAGRGDRVQEVLTALIAVYAHTDRPDQAKTYQEQLNGRASSSAPTSQP